MSRLRLITKNSKNEKKGKRSGTATEIFKKKPHKDRVYQPIINHAMLDSLSKGDREWPMSFLTKESELTVKKIFVY